MNLYSKEKKYYIFVFLFWLLIFVSPRGLLWGDSLVFSTKIRIEDFFIPVWVAYLINRRREVFHIIGSYMIVMIIMWVFFIVIFSFINSTLRDYPLLNGLIFVGKEMQFILYLCFFAVFASRNPKFAIVSFIICTIPIFLYSFWQYYQGDYKGYYGIQFPWEVGGGAASSEIGAIAAILFVTAFVIMLNRERILAEMGHFFNFGIYPITLFALLIVVLTISKSNIIGALAAISVILLLRVVSKKMGLISIVIPAIVIIAAFFIIESNPIFQLILGRFMVLLNFSIPDRVGSWQMLISYQFKDMIYDPAAAIVGFGLSSAGFIMGGKYYSLSLGVDNQYVRRLFEVGILGTIIWIVLIASIGKGIINNTKGTVYYTFFKEFVMGLFILLIFASIGLEVLQVIRIASVFYALMGILLGFSFIVLKNSRKEKY